MAETNFVDYVKIFCRSGKGGQGSMHFHREKFVQKGGPDGGDGGRGGHIIMRANKNYWTLIHLKYARHVFAGDGGEREREAAALRNSQHLVAGDGRKGKRLRTDAADGVQVAGACLRVELVKAAAAFDVAGDAVRFE